MDPLLGLEDGSWGSAAETEAVGSAYRALLQRDVAAAQQALAAALEWNPDLPSVRLVQAQLDFVQQRYQDAHQRLVPLSTEFPSYTGARLLEGRVTEALGELPAAYAAYRAAASASQPAASRAAELESRVLEILSNRIQENLDRGHVERAQEGLARLEEWVPTADATLEARWRLKAAEGDGEAELEALRELLDRRPEDRPLLVRRSELEFEVGRARQGVEILRRLAEAHPEDPELADRLEEGELRLRVSLLPGEVQELAREPQLDRGDYALFLYWLMPGVRSGRGDSPRIAADILEHPHREAIARVLNQQLMDMDETLHRFSPERSIDRRAALGSLLRVLARTGDGTNPPACLGAAGLNPRPSLEWVCSTAARCRLIADEAECLPRASVSGADALDLMSRALRRLGADEAMR